MGVEGSMDLWGRWKANMIKTHYIKFSELGKKRKMLKRAMAVTVSQRHLTDVDFHKAKGKQVQREERQQELSLREFVSQLVGYRQHFTT